jgi:TonB-linked SusC/RagA family outer membrane protein
MKIAISKKRSGITTFFIACSFLSSTVLAEQIKKDTLISPLNAPNSYELLAGKMDPSTSLTSYSSVSGERLLHRPTFQMEQFLDGTLPGLFVDMSQGYPTEKAGLKMRGRNLLIVVDGIPRSDANIPASQIESVTLLKDALGLAAWGMSSGDGILYIKTKRGDISKLSINFTAQQAVAEQIFRPQFVNSYRYAKLLNEGLVNDGGLPLFSEHDLEMYRTGANPYTHPDVDWYSELMRNNSPIKQYNLNITGGNKTTRYFIDMNLYDQQGFLKQEKAINSYNTRESFKKYSLRTNVDIQIAPNTLLAINVFGQMFNENTPGNTMMGSIYSTLHTTPNNAYPILNPMADLDGDGIPDRTYGGNSNYSNNLYAQSIESGYIKYPKTDFNFDIHLEHQFTDILKGFYLKGLYSYNSSYREQMSRTKGYEVWQYSPREGLETDDPANYTKILSASAPSRSSSYNRQNRLQYLEAAFGYQYTNNLHHTDTRLTYWSNEYIFMSNNLPMIKHGFNLNSSYNFDKRFMAQINLSQMKLNYLSSSKQWGVFPTAGLGWNIDQEGFFQSAIINTLKLRSSIGINGNDGTGSFFRAGIGGLSNYYYPYIKLYGGGSTVYLGQTNTGMNTLVESHIPYDPEHEKSRRFTIGLDATAFNNTLRASAEYFNNYHFDILMVNVAKRNSSMYGVDAQLENIGIYTQQGLEVALDYRATFNKVTLTTNAHITLASTQLINNGEPEYPEPYMQRAGKPYGQIFGYVADGFFQTQAEIDTYLSSYSLDGYIPSPGDIRYKDLNGDNIIDGLDITAIGSTAPRIEYGMYLNLEWRGIAIASQWVGLANAETIIMDMPFKINSSNSYGQALNEHLDYWTPENPTASYPRISARGNSYNERTSSFWLKDLSFLRLKNIELSYSLPKTWLNAIQLENIKLFANAYNSLTITSLEHRDPELIRYTSGSTGIVPNFKAYNAGINIQF